jgi:histone acetyltransferase (RNA polymerase elongator complex component)
MRHINIPIFIPHMGCPNQCIFCNQRYISGNDFFDESKVENDIQSVLSTVTQNDVCEIAFFGGSFTGIDRDLMVKLLDMAQKYVDCGIVSGIRMSTRPDYISKEIIDILKKYTISFVELGIQTMNDDILQYLKRGHTTNDTKNAVSLLKESKFKFIGQMMIGLPGATLEDELHCAEMICKMGASGSRIYPTLVFKQTELEHLTNIGEYKPISVEDAIYRSAKVLEVFKNYNVECIRIGLCDSENLHSDETYIAGPNSPAIGEMVKSRLFYNQICQSAISYELTNNSIIIECAPGKISQVVGNKRENIDKIRKEFGINVKKVVENSALSQYDIKIFKEGSNEIKIT